MPSRYKAADAKNDTCDRIRAKLTGMQFGERINGNTRGDKTESWILLRIQKFQNALEV